MLWTIIKAIWPFILVIVIIGLGILIWQSIPRFQEWQRTASEYDKVITMLFVILFAILARGGGK